MAAEMDSSSHQTASDLLVLLEERLRRVQYILHGDNPAAAPSTDANTNNNKPTLSASERLRKLERSLTSLTSRSPAASDILALQKQHPTLFHSTSKPSTKPSLPAPALAALILAHTQLFHQSSTHLQTLNSQSSIPDPAALAKLIALQARMERIQAKQDEQAGEFAELRARSARVVEKWYEDGVLGMGEKWAGWEERMRDAEILVRRNEAKARREREGIV